MVLHKRRVGTRIDNIDDADLLLLKKRVDIATLVIISMIAILIARLWYLQIHLGEDYAQQAEQNRVRAQVIQAPRGIITDRQGTVIVGNRPSFNVVWMKEDAPDPAEVIKALAEILHLDISVLLDRVRAGASLPPYMPLRLAEDIPWAELVYLENHRHRLPGVRIEVLPTRQYLNDEFASHFIGYLGEISKQELEKRQDDTYQGGDQVGKTGVEARHEELLRGEKGKSYVEVDVRGFEQRQLQVQEPLPGADFSLTLDAGLQQVAEEAMAGKAGAVVALEVNTGRLLVLASAPAIKLTQWAGGISHKDWQALLDNPLKPLVNKPLQGVYAPGSTYKLITAQAGLSEGVVTPDTIIYCLGSISFGNRRYGCWKRGGHGPVNMRRALAESCDVYFYTVGQRLGVDRIAQYARSFGLGALTGIDLENEKAGLVPTKAWKKQARKESWQDGETLSIAIGQGFDLATPLQICQMTAALANNGTLYRPQYVEAIADADGKVVRRFAPVVDGEVKGSRKAMALIRDGLMAVVNEKHGTGGKARLEGVLVAGKTGTAQVVRLEHYRGVAEASIPYKYRDHAWFTCYAPADKPEIAVTVLVEHGAHGGSAAAPVAREVLKQYFAARLTPADVAHPAALSVPDQAVVGD
jgi:penicillin-binding protein 2